MHLWEHLSSEISSKKKGNFPLRYRSVVMNEVELTQLTTKSKYPVSTSIYDERHFLYHENTTSKIFIYSIPFLLSWSSTLTKMLFKMSSSTTRSLASPHCFEVISNKQNWRNINSSANALILSSVTYFILYVIKLLHLHFENLGVDNINNNLLFWH